ncbi:hypothetical protein PR202_ga08763 [Eleusine coracana subsp. coracana]|uniref:KIB1-4 beta-propeller domain-containing protein n=1 Tax=Eleusine coracana subsp. coracana TaxID=191504 RepID=A0AAV5C271_ELECO|nr:hypothetical protein QOZ80_1AG0043080 [Eleusine coracana subsp. coracana]GJM92302.1 hypothetical protein PR202_ga08763 [Eleusine coracana subsp. coracana]
MTSTDASSSRDGVHVPYLALKKNAAGSDEPVLFNLSETKAIGGGIDQEGNRISCALKNNNCWATPQGWVLVRDAASSSTYLLDPQSISNRRRIELPHLPEENLPTVCTCLLSEFPDTTTVQHDTCLVLLIESHAPVIHYCHIDDAKWTKHEYDIGTQDLPDLGNGCCEKLIICSIAACEGKFYFNGGFRELGVLEFCPAPMFSSIAIRDAIPQPPGFQREFLVESQEELYMVSLLSHYDMDIVYRFHVYKMDFSTQEWREVDDIGDRVFMLSSWYFGASLSAQGCGLQPNCVYVPYPWNKCIKIFNIKDGTEKVLNLDEAPESDLASCPGCFWRLARLRATF